VAAEGQFGSFEVATLSMLRTALPTRYYATTIVVKVVGFVGSALGIVVARTALHNAGELR
jgi:hypothetical protein